MRQIGTLPNEELARRFQDYLLTRDIKMSVDAEDGHWVVWIVDEDDVDVAREELEQFNANADDDRYLTAVRAADQRRQEHHREEAEYKKNFVDVRQKWRKPATSRAPVTMALLGASIVVGLMTDMGFKQTAFLSQLKIDSTRMFHSAPHGTLYYESAPDALFHDVKRGQVWRLITPIFLHFGIWHLFFNGYMIYQIGPIVESRKGSLAMVFFVLLMGIPSNVCQYLVTGPSFGGLSGVLYGLFGYVWMKSRFDPMSGFYMSQSTVMILMIWLFLGFAEVIPHIANWAHAIGLVMGMLIGYGTSMAARPGNT